MEKVINVSDSIIEIKNDKLIIKAPIIKLENGLTLSIGNQEKPFVRVGKIDASGSMVVDFRSEQSIECANKITAFPFTMGVD